MSEHTRGPWFVAFDEDPEDIRVCQQSPDQMEPHCMCCVALMGNTDERGRWTRGTVEEWLANARVIAAAPEMLEALEALMDPSGSLDAKHRKARAAIAKARNDQCGECPADAQDPLDTDAAKMECYPEEYDGPDLKPERDEGQKP